MLVLSRKSCESLVISDNVVVRILEIRGNHVSLGIEAPQDVSIMRSELLPDDEVELAVIERTKEIGKPR
jgi:carbon storage regulator